MANRFEQVDEVVGDAATIVLSERADGQWATVVRPKSEHEARIQDRMTEPMPPKEALSGAVRFANRSRSLFRTRMASGNRNGASSTEMKASDAKQSSPPCHRGLEIVRCHSRRTQSWPIGNPDRHRLP